jgi:hypothetical protein
VSQFEDLTALPGLGFPLRTYKGVDFSGINVASFRSSSTANSFTVQTPPNFALIAFRTLINGDLIAVSPKFPFIKIGTPNLTIDYEGSPYKSFDGERVFFNCAAMTTAPVVVPVDCTVRFSAVYGNGDVKVRSVPYEAMNKQKEVDLRDDFKGMKEMRIALESSQLPVGYLLTTIGLDSFRFVLHKD